MKHLLFAILFLLCLPSMSQHSNGRKKSVLNRYFSYEKTNNGSFLLYIHGDSVLSFSKGTLASPTTLWVKLEDHYKLIDTSGNFIPLLFNKITIADPFYAKDSTCYNTWINYQKGWELISQKGESLTARSWYYKEEIKGTHWNVMSKVPSYKCFVNENGKSGKETFNNYFEVSGKQHIYAIRQDKWYLYDYSIDEKNSFGYDSIVVAGESTFLLMAGTWQLAKINDLKHVSITALSKGPLLVPGNRAPFFLIQQNEKWIKYQNISPTIPEKDTYETVFTSDFNGCIYGKSNGQWFVIYESGNIPISYNDRQVKRLHSKLNNKEYNIGYDNERTLNLLDKLYQKGFIPSPVNTIELRSFQGNELPASVKQLVTNANESEELYGVYDYLYERFIMNPVYTEIEQLPAGYFQFYYGKSEHNYQNGRGIADSTGKIIIPGKYMMVEDRWLDNGTGRVFICQLAPGIFDLYDCEGVKMNSEPLLCHSLQDLIIERRGIMYYIIAPAFKKIPAKGYAITQYETNYKLQTLTDKKQVEELERIWNDPDQLLTWQTK